MVTSMHIDPLPQCRSPTPPPITECGIAEAVPLRLFAQRRTDWRPRASEPSDFDSKSSGWPLPTHSSFGRIWPSFRATCHGSGLLSTTKPSSMLRFRWHSSSISSASFSFPDFQLFFGRFVALRNFRGGEKEVSFCTTRSCHAIKQPTSVSEQLMSNRL